MNNIQEAAEEYAQNFKTQVSSEGLQNIISDFEKGALSPEAKEYWFEQFKKQSAGVWVKASERLPRGYSYGLLVRYNYNGKFWDKELGDDNLVFSLIDNGWQDVEWLDESQPQQPVYSEDDLIRKAIIYGINTAKQHKTIDDRYNDFIQSLKTK